VLNLASDLREPRPILSPSLSPTVCHTVVHHLYHLHYHHFHLLLLVQSFILNLRCGSLAIFSFPTGLILCTLVPFNVFLLLNGWICRLSNELKSMHFHSFNFIHSPEGNLSFQNCSHVRNHQISDMNCAFWFRNKSKVIHNKACIRITTMLFKLEQSFGNKLQCTVIISKI